MLNDILLLTKNHEIAARNLLSRILPEYKRKYIISISGEVDTGKAEVAHMLGKLLKKEGIRVKMMFLDSYYKVPPLERFKWRKDNGLECVGPMEYDWDKINQNIDEFLKDQRATMPCVDLFTGQIDQLITDFKDIDILIIAGLYAMKIEQADFRVFIEMTYKETINEQIASGKEELDEFRMKVLEQEHKAVMSLKRQADYYLDFYTGELFHY
jgi:uridine kinase